MFDVTHFRSEFVRQRDATIVRKVTMTQFMLAITFAAVGVGFLGALLPAGAFWLAPLFVALGYTAGYPHQGEILLRRWLATLAVWGRHAAARPRLVNVQAEWEAAQETGREGAFQVTVTIEGENGERVVY